METSPTAMGLARIKRANAKIMFASYSAFVPSSRAPAWGLLAQMPHSTNRRLSPGAKKRKPAAPVPRGRAHRAIPPGAREPYSREAARKIQRRESVLVDSPRHDKGVAHAADVRGARRRPRRSRRG